MKKMLDKISHKICTSYCDNDNIAYTERVLENGQKVFHFMNMSSGSEEHQTFTIHVKNGEEVISKTLDVGVCEIKEVTF